MEMRPAIERGESRFSWLYSRHTFSFGDYYDPAFESFRTLRVINDDIIQPSAGFGEHGHRDMEIISVVLSGALEHRDSLGNGSVLRPGEVQVMTAGSGIRHSEFNPSATEETHLLQIWILPSKKGLTPTYAQEQFPRAKRRNRFQRVAGESAAANDGALHINQDANIYLGALDDGSKVKVGIAPGRAAWIHVATGVTIVNGTSLSAGDGASENSSSTFTFEGLEDGTEVLLFDLA